MFVKRKIFIINLPNETTRFEFIKKQFAKIGLDVERVEGVYADTLSSEFIATIYSPEANRKSYVRPLHKGQIACYLAHIKAWKKIIEDNLDYAIVLEDDAKIINDFNAGVEFLDNTFGKWEFVRIQANAKLKKIFCEKNFGDFSFVQYINTTGNTIAQAISKQAAEKMIKNLIPFGMPVDVNQQYYYKIGVRVESLRPPIISESEIGNNSIINRFNTRNKSHYPFVRQILSVKFYTGRLIRLIREYGFFSTIKNLINMISAQKIY